MATTDQRKRAMLAYVDRHGRMLVAGIVECQTALELIKAGELVRIGGVISPTGGTGMVGRPSVVHPEET
jgi:hypothetical protein